MIVKCTQCHAEWQTVENDKPCYDCGASGTSIGSDYMSECDDSIGPCSQNNDVDEENNSMTSFLGKVNAHYKYR